MAQYDHLPIYKATYALLLELMQITKDFPRDYKYSLGEKIQTGIIDLLVDIYKTNSARDKREYIIDMMAKIQHINLYLRISYDLKLIPQQRFAVIVEQSGSIARQAQGWLKSVSVPSEVQSQELKQGIA